MPVPADDFRRSTRLLASAVTIVTTLAGQDSPRGITATAVCPLSWEPPLLLVCLDRSSASYADFAGCANFTVNVLRPEHVPLAQRFAVHGADKFAGTELAPHEFDLPALPDALLRLVCTTHARHDIGDHSILVGRVDHLAANDGEPVVYYARQYRRLALDTPAP